MNGSTFEELVILLYHIEPGLSGASKRAYDYLPAEG